MTRATNDSPPPVPENQPTGVVCAWCGNVVVWADVAGFFKRLKYCKTCLATISFDPDTTVEPK